MIQRGMTRSKPGGKILLITCDIRCHGSSWPKTSWHVMIHTLCVFQKMMHSASGNGNAEMCIHVISRLLYFCMYACLQAYSHARANTHHRLHMIKNQWRIQDFPEGRCLQTYFEHSSRKLHKIEKKLDLRFYRPLDPTIKTSVADLSICMWSLTLISRFGWSVYLDVLNKQCRWWCNVNWTVFIQRQRDVYVVYVPLIHRDTHRDYTHVPDTHLRIRLQIQSTDSKEMIG